MGVTIQEIKTAYNKLFENCILLIRENELLKIENGKLKRENDERKEIINALLKYYNADVDKMRERLGSLYGKI